MSTKMIWEQGTQHIHRLIAFDAENEVVLEIVEADSMAVCRQIMNELLKK